MRIMLANPSRMAGHAGGVQKVCSAFANEMTRRGHEVCIVYSDENTGPFFYPVDSRILAVNLNVREDGSVIRFPLHLKAAREVLRGIDKRRARAVNDWFQSHSLIGNARKAIADFRPDVIVSYTLAASRLLLCDIRTKIPVITMSHGDPEDYFRTYPVKELPALGLSAANQVLMPSFEKAIRSRFPESKTVTIGNAIPQFDFAADLEKEKPEHKIVFVGRLTRGHKRPHLLIEAFGKIAKQHPGWTLELWGPKDREPYYQELASLIKKHGLEGRAFLKGPTEDVPSVLRGADLFAFPSAFEGFGMAVAEAMSAGLPAVAFRSCPAVNELIEDGKTGFLCGDGTDELALALDALMSDTALRARMGRAAKAAMAEFAPDRIWDRWEKLLAETAEARGVS